MSESILIIYTGGTIGMTSREESDVLRPFDFEEIRKHVPEIRKFGYQLDAITIEPVLDSSNMKPESWVKIAEVIRDQYEQYDGFVILHGTDTMAFTASALSFMLENLGKPVILTGSQLPVNILRTDARENLISSIEIAAAKKDGLPMVPEVCIYFEYKLLRGNRTTKMNAENFNAFQSPNYPPLAESGVHLKFHHHRILKREYERPMKVHTRLDNRITILKIFPGITQHTVEALLSDNQLKAVILETFGAGNAPTDDWFSSAIRETSARGVLFLNITQCLQGQVEMGRYETSEQLIDAGVISGYDSTPETAVAKLMFLLGQNRSLPEIKLLLNKSLNGEITIL